MTDEQSNPSGGRCVCHDGPCDPFQQAMRFTTPDGDSEFTAEFTVPADRYLVIEQVTANADPPSGQIVRYFSLRTTLNGVFVFYTLPAVYNGFADYVCCEQVRICADPGSLVKLSAPRSAGTGEFLTVAAVSGRLYVP